MKQIRMATGARYLVGLVFIFAGATKLPDPHTLAKSIDGFGLIPAFMIMPLALWLPFLEIVCGSACLFKATARPALIMLAFLTTIFTVAIMQAMARGIAVNCGCFGAQEWLVSSPPIALIRNSFLISLSIWAYCHLVKANFR